MQYKINPNTGLWQYWDGNAIDCDQTLSGPMTIQYNYSHNNEGGFLQDGSYNVGTSSDLSGAQAIVRYNISENDGFCVDPAIPHKMFQLSRGNAQIYNNTFYNSTNGGFNILEGGLGGTLPNIFKNNIFVGNIFTITNWYGITDTYDNNFYSGISNSQDSHPLTGDPMFVSPGTGPTGYKLQQFSPCIGQGNFIAEGLVDYWGAPVSYSIDIGASEYNPNRGYQLLMDQFLGIGDYLLSSNGKYYLTLNNYGNVTLQNLSTGENIIWQTNTTGVTSLMMQEDGYLAAYAPGHQLYWHSNNPVYYGNGPVYTLVLQDDGNLVIYKGTVGVPANSIWASNTLGQ